MLRFLSFLALAVLSALPASAAGPLKAGERAPAFKIPGVDGKAISLQRFRGKPIYLNFFATWCAPCREETPGIVKLFDHYKKRGLEVIAIDFHEDKDHAGDWHDQYKIPYPVGLGDNKMTDEYGVIALPVHVFIDRKGIVRGYRLGEMSIPEIEAGIKGIL
ncbi:MAG: TlpA family protein disulfide reductase [Candidatus Eremiobacteraeota bacterium]|nr:TlpA family protein disulfide reductase [Candidatus Eremiobacteraeota bacterium]MBV8354728.1 TlpA family protein disulfide reductase [Candidatus Eremiobacteraeota bacterium]